MAAGTGRYVTAVAGSLASAVMQLLKEWQYRSDIHKLHALSDRQLSDIGLTRGRIEAAVRGGASREVAERLVPFGVASANPQQLRIMTTKRRMPCSAWAYPHLTVYRPDLSCSKLIA